MKTKQRRCLPCKIDNKINHSIIEMDGIPLCKHHYEIYKVELENLDVNEEFED